jgi:hypothetical protein
MRQRHSDGGNGCETAWPRPVHTRDVLKHETGVPYVTLASHVWNFCDENPVSDGFSVAGRVMGEELAARAALCANPVG